MNWLAKLLGLCKHKWKILSNTKWIRGSTGFYATQEFRIIVYGCTKCGKLKKMRIP